jgi:hypothetical protein
MNFMLDLQFLYYLLCATCVFNKVDGQEFLMRTKLTVYGLEGVHGSILGYGICLLVLLGLYQSLLRHTFKANMPSCCLDRTSGT